MADGSITKRCGCRNNGKRLGATCPKLRRGNGWNPHHGSWRYQLELPLDAAHGRRQLRRTGFDTREDAVDERDRARALLDLAGRDELRRRQIADLLQAVKPNQPLPDRDHVARRIRADVPADNGLTLGDYLAEWIKGRTRLAPATRRSYQDHITKYWTPQLGQVALQELTAAHIESVFAAIDSRNDEVRAAKASPVKEIRDSVKGIRMVGEASQQRILATLRKALNDARRLYHHKLVDHNPAESVELASGKPPKPRLWTDAAVNRWRRTGQRPSPVMVWTPAQVGEFLDFAEAEDPGLYPLFDLAIHRGPRRGELCGLHDYDVDLEAAAITITGQRTSVGYQVIEKDVKSAAGDRVVDLSDETVTSLRRYLSRRAGWKVIAGDAWVDSDIFFVRQRDGQPWHPETVTGRFDRLVARSGLPPVRFHDLRHVAATLMLAAGASIKEIQDTLGHSSYKMTADIYTSVLAELKKTTAEATIKLIPRRNRPTPA
ncbi:tyrosine-type recombinase/integrase [Solwaraspora sp. WMMD1047]|uniref:tyrosine-type recombinase/integrase n=1 Tax=Solwaraspora sp. WMMD1047 TaxID=3016102 RepID=UPI0024178F9F|nr:tyrosine-type recombinase/integrase [Solwaraspora sp. WMMD1047]MDG4834118.1 tyrosine-type recombinase/integrase [Solwaraspora sp. WMMD1047]